jgi:hypothetical protein
MLLGVWQTGLVRGRWRVSQDGRDAERSRDCGQAPHAASGRQAVPAPASAGVSPDRVRVTCPVKMGMRLLGNTQTLK